MLGNMPSRYTKEIYIGLYIRVLKTQCNEERLVAAVHFAEEQHWLQ
jgi:hypothetical protein